MTSRFRNLTTKRRKKKEFVDTNNLSELLKAQKDLSMKIFLSCLRERYESFCEHTFSIKDYKFHFNDFIKRYPIVYSATHALRSCTGDNFLYDCVIIDESSQVDLISAVIAFSVAKRVVLAGDEKQLPHVVKSQLFTTLNNIFAEYKLPEYFDYAKNSVLHCVLKKEKKIISTLLNEHYRCDPLFYMFFGIFEDFSKVKM